MRVAAGDGERLAEALMCGPLAGGPVTAVLPWFSAGGTPPGGDLAHYAGDPMSDYIQPFNTDHAPFLP